MNLHKDHDKKLVSCIVPVNSTIRLKPKGLLRLSTKSNNCIPRAKLVTG